MATMQPPVDVAAYAIHVIYVIRDPKHGNFAPSLAIYATGASSDEVIGMDSCKAASCRVVLCCIAGCLGSGYVYADTEPSDAEQVAVTFFTEPANASLYSATGGLYGATPLTLYYELPQSWDGCVQLEPLQAVWVSGVDSQVQLTACPENSHSQHYTFTRPDLAGADLDLWFAEKVKQLAMVEDPVSLAKDPAHAATVEPLSGNLVTCSDHGQNPSGCR